MSGLEVGSAIGGNLTQVSKAKTGLQIPLDYGEPTGSAFSQDGFMITVAQPPAGDINTGDAPGSLEIRLNNLE